MLKIKDNVDLYTFKDFGFEFNEKQNQIEKYTDKLENVGSYFWSKVYINLETREINATPMESQEYISYETLNTLYDLIKADLVEKVEED